MIAGDTPEDQLSISNFFFFFFFFFLNLNIKLNV